MAVCAVCGTEVAAKQRGRPRAYCSRACQAKAYRARQDAPGRSDAEVRRLAAFHAALAVESALANGWETLDRYGDDRPRVEAALNELLDELQRRGRSKERRRPEGPRAQGPVATDAEPVPSQGDAVSLPVDASQIAPAAVPAGRAPGPAARDESPIRDENQDRDAAAPEPTVPASAPAAVPAPEASPASVLPVVAPTLQAPSKTEAVSVQVWLEALVHDLYLVVADGSRIGWIERAAQEERGWRVHTADGGAVAVTDGFGLHQASLAAARALLGPDVALVDCGLATVTDHRDRTLDLDVGSLARWELWRGRVLGRTDVMVRHRCLGWLQKLPGGRVVACTPDGPVPGSAGRDRARAVKALFAAWWAPVPLPELGEEFFAPRRIKARPGKTKPLCPYTEGQLAAAAANPPRRDDGGYQVLIRDRWDRDHDVELGQVRKQLGRRTLWVAYTPDGRSVASGQTRTQAIEAMLAIPGPLFGDPTETLLHDLAEHDLDESVTKTPPVTKTGTAEHDDELDDGLEVPGRCPASARHEWMEFACLRRDGHPGAHRAITPTRHKSPVRWEEGGPVTDLQGRPLLRGTLPPTSSTSRRWTAR